MAGQVYPALWAEIEARMQDRVRPPMSAADAVEAAAVETGFEAGADAGAM
jgi:hypothetical protein